MFDEVYWCIFLWCHGLCKLQWLRILMCDENRSCHCSLPCHRFRFVMTDYARSGRELWSLIASQMDSAKPAIERERESHLFAHMFNHFLGHFMSWDMPNMFGIYRLFASPSLQPSVPGWRLAYRKVMLVGACECSDGNLRPLGGLRMEGPCLSATFFP